MRLRRCLVVLVFIAVAFAAFGQQAQVIRSRTLDNFDDPTTQEWTVSGSRFVADGFPQLAFVDAWPNALYGRNLEDRDLKVLGIRGAFTRRGYNYIEIIPTVDGEPQALPVPGQARQIDAWVWGANFNYYLEVHLRDYRGVDYVLPMGSLQFTGWRNLTSAVPNYIPQQQPYLPRFKGLELTKLVLWTRPEEVVNDFFFYLDELGVITDLFQERFDGDDLVQAEIIDQVWGGQ